MSTRSKAAEGRYEPYAKEKKVEEEVDEVVELPGSAPTAEGEVAASDTPAQEAEAPQEPTEAAAAEAGGDAGTETAEAAQTPAEQGQTAYPMAYSNVSQAPADQASAYDPKNTMLGKYGLADPSQQAQQPQAAGQDAYQGQQQMQQFAGYPQGQEQPQQQQQQQYPSQGYGQGYNQAYGQQQQQVTVTPNPQSDVVINGESASCVVHFRNVAPTITVQDIQLLCSPFGNDSVHIVMMRAKNQALAQFGDLQSSINFVQYYTDNPCQIRGRRVYVKFSRHQQLRQRNNPSKVLLVTLQADYPLIQINIDSIWQLFSSYGFVEKIVIIKRKEEEEDPEGRETNTRQVLVQFSQQFCAASAMQALNGQVVLCGDLQLNLTIQYSNLNTLIVRQQGPESRDYLELYQQQMQMQQGQYGAQPYGMQGGMPMQQGGMPMQGGGMPMHGGMPMQGGNMQGKW